MLRLTDTRILHSELREALTAKRLIQPMSVLGKNLERVERTSVRPPYLIDNERVFDSLFERSADAIWLLEVQGQTVVLVDCNQAAVELVGAKNKQQLLRARPEDTSPPFQPDGSPSAEKAAEIVAIVQKQKTHRFEWALRRLDGKIIPIEVSVTAVIRRGRHIHVAISRDISERMNAERELVQLNQSLERRVSERTAALSASEAKFRALFEESSQGIVLHDENQILEVNPSAVRIMGCKRPQELLGKHPADISPPFQPNGESSAVLAREYIQQCMANGSARFDWVSKTPQGKQLSLEVTLTRIEWSGRQIIQALVNDIGERKRAEAELRASEARLRESEARFSAAFRASPVSIVIYRMDDSRCVLANEAFLKWAGYRLNEVLGRTSLDLGIWEDMAERALLWQELRRTQSIHERECRMRNRQGKSFIMLISADVIEIRGLPHLLAVGLDITERKRAQAALAESEARFSAAFHASPALIGILRVSDGQFVLANDAHLSWLGYPREEVLGHTCVELGMWVDPAERDLLLNDIHASGSVRQRECRWRNRHGEHFTVLLSAETITLNHTPHVLLMALDITQRKRAEEEVRASEARLRESENRFSVAFQASPVFISIFRTSTEKYVLANDALLNWLGYGREDVLGCTSGELSMWDNPAERLAVWRDLRTVGSIRQRECRWRNRQNELATVLLSAETITLDNEPHVLSLVLDITQRKNAEVEMHKALTREKELSELKSNFVSMVSHEFRTPLGIIQSSTELLRDFNSKMQSDERDEHLNSIARNTGRMAGMMEEVLVLSRLDAGKLIFEPADLDLNVLFRRVVDEMLSATNRRCPIELSLKSIPSEAQADERLLGHIFTNLLSNAVKYSEAGGIVHLAVERHGANARCIVHDHGIGISEEDQQQLFEAFHRGQNVGRRPGTGLGLLLVKRCVELHGGNVQVHSKIGQGTTVTVNLPVFGNKS
jgi:PAS domain S-box-containing protein